MSSDENITSIDPVAYADLMEQIDSLIITLEQTKHALRMAEHADAEFMAIQQEVEKVMDKTWAVQQEVEKVMNETRAMQQEIEKKEDERQTMLKKIQSYQQFTKAGEGTSRGENERKRELEK
ncbi:MAG: hypothetical protein ASARMPRED_001312 [Alectoria sarmentosa]|nr:MAG: hypothetical protein ASARMPRED_001312 [Alectoria sarmentosa]